MLKTFDPAASVDRAERPFVERLFDERVADAISRQVGVYPQDIDNRDSALNEAISLYELGYDFEIAVSPGQVETNPGAYGFQGEITAPIYNVLPSIQVSRGEKLQDFGQVVDGGIDIQNIDVNKTGNAKIKFDDDALKQVLSGGFDGFMPVFIKMTPLDSPLRALGVN